MTDITEVKYQVEAAIESLRTAQRNLDDEGDLTLEDVSTFLNDSDYVLEDLEWDQDDAIRYALENKFSGEVYKCVDALVDFAGLEFAQIAKEAIELGELRVIDLGFDSDTLMSQLMDCISAEQLAENISRMHLLTRGGIINALTEKGVIPETKNDKLKSLMLQIFKLLKED